MKTSTVKVNVLASFAALFLAACGGGSSTSSLSISGGGGLNPRTHPT